MQEEIFEDFSENVVSSVIKKNWSLSYKGKEITGSYSYEHDAWGYYERNVDIDEDCLKDLTAEEIDEINDYVSDVI